MTSVVNALGDRFEEQGEIDAIADYAHWMPIRAICRFFGIPESDVPIFERWSADLSLAFSISIAPEARARLDRAVTGMSAYVRETIASRRRRPQSDLVTSLVEARDQGDRLTEDEMVAMIGNIIMGAHDTTKCSIGCTLLSLSRHPDQWRKLCADPSRVAAAAEESLRRDPAAIWLMRVVTAPFTCGGLSFEPGDRFVISPLGANHDPAKYPDSQRFDMDRNAGDQMSFGLGPHFCVGSWIARMYVQETIRMFASRFPGLHCIEEEVAWTPLFEFRRPERLRLRAIH